MKTHRKHINERNPKDRNQQPKRHQNKDRENSPVGDPKQSRHNTADRRNHGVDNRSASKFAKLKLDDSLGRVAADDVLPLSAVTQKQENAYEESTETKCQRISANALGNTQQKSQQNRSRLIGKNLEQLLTLIKFLDLS